jgi:microcystin-dependent protein
MLAFAASAVNTSIAYQGVLKNATGTQAITGQRNITFRLYNVATGGNPLWERTMAVQLDEGGLFNVELIDDQGAPEGTARLVDALKAARGGTLYIGIEVLNSAGEIQPRQKIMMVPYSSWAADVSTASENFTVEGKATLRSAEVLGNFTADGKANFNGAATFAQPVTFSGNVTVKNSASVTANNVAANNVTVANKVTAKTVAATGAVSASSFTGLGTIPVGGIIMWSGAENNIPEGWKLCNGQTAEGKKTPDLRGRFIVCAGSNSGYNVNDRGGADMVTLSVEQIPSHSHSYAFKGADLDGAWDGDNYFYDASGHYDKNNNTRWTNATGGGQPHENRPPYYALCFIMRVK